MLKTLKVYQRFISPCLRQNCRFFPSCSLYAEQAIKTRGLLYGICLIIWRLLRCQPFCAGGYDPVPKSCVIFEPSKSKKEELH